MAGSAGSTRWARNERLREKCIEDQVASAHELTDLSQQYAPDSVEWSLIAGCINRWVRGGGAKSDFRMALTCSEIEIAGYQSRIR